jgi:hypothetical protein
MVASTNLSHTAREQPTSILTENLPECLQQAA